MIGRKSHLGNLSESSTDEQIRRHSRIRSDYGYLLDRYPLHPVVMEDKVVRWKGNDVVRLMIDKYIDLNQLWADFYRSDLSIEDMATVYRMMGYSLCGFLEIFEEKLEEKA